MYYENDRGRVYYEIHGEDNGAPAVLFSHGRGLDHRTFMPQVHALKQNYRTIAWDMPYHGMSSDLDYRMPYMSTAADFIVDILDHTGTDEAILVGQSLGSFVTQHAAHRHPERVKATVHIGGAPLYPGYTPMLKLLNPLIALVLALCPGRLIFRAQGNAALNPDTRAYVEKATANTGKRALSHTSQELLRDMVRGLPEPATEPVLLIHGEHESSVLKKLMRKMNDHAPDSRLAVIDEAGHIANEDNPDEVNGILLSFLDELAR